MTLSELIRDALASWPASLASADCVAVSTHCLYPSNGIIQVYVSGGASAFKVTDGGGALDEFSSSGGGTLEEISYLRAAAKPHGLDVTAAGVIYSPLVSVEQLVGTIVLVANASKEAAHTLTSRFIPAPKKNFREMLAKLIDVQRAQGMFLDVSIHRTVVGASTKSHKFDYDISLAGKKRLLLDTVVPEASSINSVLAANLDVQQAEIPNTLQRIVYDDEDDWKQADLALLGLGAVVVPFTKLRPVLGRLAA